MLKPVIRTTPLCKLKTSCRPLVLSSVLLGTAARSFTATSGPGISLMSEFIGLAYFAELPAVIWDIQRSGPSTGMPTRTQQGDLIGMTYASHGDTKHPVVVSGDAKRVF